MTKDKEIGGVSDVFKLVSILTYGGFMLLGFSIGLEAKKQWLLEIQDFFVVVALFIIAFGFGIRIVLYKVYRATFRLKKEDGEG